MKLNQAPIVLLSLAITGCDPGWQRREFASLRKENADLRATIKILDAANADRDRASAVARVTLTNEFGDVEVQQQQHARPPGWGTPQFRFGRLLGPEGELLAERAVLRNQSGRYFSFDLMDADGRVTGFKSFLMDQLHPQAIEAMGFNAAVIENVAIGDHNRALDRASRIQWNATIAASESETYRNVTEANAASQRAQAESVAAEAARQQAIADTRAANAAQLSAVADLAAANAALFSSPIYPVQYKQVDVYHHRSQ